MQFTVPQFIEHETKIVGPLTFKQFAYIGGAGTVCFILYFSLGKTNFLLFLLLAIILLGGGTALAFLKIGGKPLPSLLANFLKFSASPKIYLWGRKEIPLTIWKEAEVKKEEEKEEELPLKIAKDSKLKKIKIQIDTKTIP